jgi:Leucine-rich repeat (LRR) protein
MRTKLLLLFLLANFSIYAQYTSIPDINFENKLIALGIDSGVADGKVLKTSIATVTDLDVSYLSISSLSGIQDFVNLKTLKCTNNNIISLSIYNLTQLKSLDCNNNKIASLFLINNSLLEYLDCSYNQLNSLSVTSNLKLTSLNL